MLTSHADRHAADVDHRSGLAAVEQSDIRVSLPARAENVAVVRQLIGALGTTIGLAPAMVDDMRLAVTEACTNVVRHAYDAGGGRVDVVIRPHGDAVDVLVCDRGRGIGSSPDAAGPGLGLPLIAALADELEIQHAPRRGSRLAMRFVRRPAAQAAVGAM